MKKRTIKAVLFALLITMSISSFVYVNTAPIERALSVEMLEQPVKTDNQETIDANSKMPDLTFVKGVLSIIQTFLPAK
jgi:hypothetical protein